MKTIRDYVQSLQLNRANVDHCITTGTINGSLLKDLENMLKAYGEDCAERALSEYNICGYNCTCISSEYCKEK